MWYFPFMVATAMMIGMLVVGGDWKQMTHTAIYLLIFSIIVSFEAASKFKRLEETHIAILKAVLDLFDTTPKEDNQESEKRDL